MFNKLPDDIRNTRYAVIKGARNSGKLYASQRQIAYLLKQNEKMKSHTEHLVRQAASDARKAFAEKIFREITDAVLHNDAVIQERVEKRNANRYEDDICIMCDAKIRALGGIEYFIKNLLEEMEVEG